MKRLSTLSNDDTEELNFDPTVFKNTLNLYEIEIFDEDGDDDDDDDDAGVEITPIEAVDDELLRPFLHSECCYVLDCGNEMFVWFGVNSTPSARQGNKKNIKFSKLFFQFWK